LVRNLLLTGFRVGFVEFLRHGLRFTVKDVRFQVEHVVFGVEGKRVES
jgi:hypothetical protein